MEKRITPEKYIVNPETGCWEWQWSKNEKGYGKIQVDGKLCYAHRVSHEENIGPIPDGLVIDHLCRNTSCVNPEHIEAVPQSTNAQRGIRTRLSSEQAVEIRERYAAGGVTAQQLGWEYGAAKTHVLAILKGRKWASAGGPRFTENMNLKYTDAEVAAMTRLRRSGWTLRQIAERYGLSYNKVYGLLEGNDRKRRVLAVD